MTTNPKHSLSLRLRVVLAVLASALPLWRLALQRRMLHGKESPASCAQKLMQDAPEQPPVGAPLVWGHAVGVGEVLALLGLFRQLAVHMPAHHFLLTSTSLTSGLALSRQQLPANIHHRFAPIDHPRVMAQFLARFQPQAACWSEMDLWPHMLLSTRALNIPMLLLNARLDTLKAKQRARHAWFYKPIFQSFSHVYAQNASSHQLLQALQVSGLNAAVGNIKALAPAQSVDAQERARWQLVLADRPVWLLASSHEGEETIAMEAHQMLLAQHPKALLLITPRDAFRGAAIAQLAQKRGLLAALRSRDEPLSRAHRIYVADTMGELGLWYVLSRVALIGGSLVPIGGHNPYEALAAGCAVLSGPLVHNFSESYEELMASGSATTVNSAAQVCQAVLKVWQQSLPESPSVQPLSYAANDQAKNLMSNILQVLQVKPGA